MHGSKVNFSLRIDFSVPRETKSALFLVRSQGMFCGCAFVGQICCSTHESVLFLFSSKVVTHGNMQFEGKGEAERESGVEGGGGTF